LLAIWSPGLASRQQRLDAVLIEGELHGVARCQGVHLNGIETAAPELRGTRDEPHAKGIHHRSHDGTTPHQLRKRKQRISGAGNFGRSTFELPRELPAFAGKPDGSLCLVTSRLLVDQQSARSGPQYGERQNDPIVAPDHPEHLTERNRASR
jgi:hypothetical protein